MASHILLDLLWSFSSVIKATNDICIELQEHPNAQPWQSASNHDLLWPVSGVICKDPTGWSTPPADTGCRQLIYKNVSALEMISTILIIQIIHPSQSWIDSIL